MDLATTWLALTDVRLHDPAADAVFRGAYDPVAAAAEDDRCRASSRQDAGAAGCEARPRYTFLEWWRQDGATVGWIDTGDGWNGPADHDVVKLTRLDADLVRVESPHLCDGTREETVELHLVSETQAWTTFCGKRVELVRGEGVRARRDRWNRETVEKLLGSRPPKGLGRTSSGWTWKGQPTRCYPALRGCDPSQGIVVACSGEETSTAFLPTANGWWTVTDANVAMCVLPGWGGVELPPAVP